MTVVCGERGLIAEQMDVFSEKAKGSLITINKVCARSRKMKMVAGLR